jgi:K+ transporter
MAKWREHLFSMMYRNAAGAERFFLLPHDRVVEVGVQVPI